MKHSTVVIAIICILLLIGTIALAHAEHDYFSPLWTWDGEPILCLVNIPDEDLYMALRAADAWKEASSHYNNFTTYTIIVTQSGEMVDCNGYLYFSNQFKPNPYTGVVPIGTTQCQMETGKCEIRIDKKDPAWYDTIVHEVGHFLGVSHRLSYETKGIIGVFLSNDIMMPVQKPNVYISKESLDALVYFNSGFIKNYTIPHNNGWNQDSGSD